MWLETTLVVMKVLGSYGGIVNHGPLAIVHTVDSLCFVLLAQCKSPWYQVAHAWCYLGEVMGTQVRP